MINKLIEILPKKLDGVLITSEVNRRYFTGFPSSDGILLITKKGSVFLTDSRYIEAAKNRITCCDVEELKKTSEQLPYYCKKFGCHTLGIEADRMTVSELAGYRKMLKGILLTGQGTDKLINRIRMVKEEHEVQCIRKAQSIAEDALENVLKLIKIGVTEKEIALSLDYYMLSHGAEALSFETIAVSGKNSSMPHGVPTDKKIERGDFITMDFGAVYNGYHSDMTRTVAVGEVSSRQAEVYETVLKAQNTSLDMLREGLPCADADKAARDVIGAAGYGEYFRHGTGHGVGVEIHEFPVLSPKSPYILTKGNIVTVEPGIYIPGQFGVRIEDMACINKENCENLTKISKELVVL